MSNLQIILIVYILGYIACFITGVIALYIEWKNGDDIKLKDILCISFVSIFSWCVLIIALIKGIEYYSEKVIIKGKKGKKNKT